MTTPQVSIWVPIVVGAIGLLGVILGQLISSRREDRRWRREQEREDVRWQRETERLARERQEANRAHWRDKKFEIYTSFLEFMKEWSSVIDHAARQMHRNKTVSAQGKDACEKYSQDSFEHRNAIELIATDSAAAKTMFDAISLYIDWSTPMTIDMKPMKSDETTIDAFVDSNDEVIYIVIAAIRADLDIASDADRDYLGRIGDLAS